MRHVENCTRELLDAVGKSEALLFQFVLKIIKLLNYRHSI